MHFFLLSLRAFEESCKWCHWALPREGSCMRTYQGHSKPYSALSPLHARPQLQLSVGSWQQEVPTTGLWLHLSISPRTLSSSQGLSTRSKERSQAFVWGSGSCLPHSFWGNSWKAALKNLFVSCIPSRSFISWLLSSRFLQRDGRAGLGERTGSTPLRIPGTRSSDPNHSSQSPQWKIFTDAKYAGHFLLLPISPSQPQTYQKVTHILCLSSKMWTATFSCFCLRTAWKD